MKFNHSRDLQGAEHAWGSQLAPLFRLPPWAVPRGVDQRQVPGASGAKSLDGWDSILQFGGKFHGFDPSMLPKIDGLFTSLRDGNRPHRIVGLTQQRYIYIKGLRPLPPTPGRE